MEITQESHSIDMICHTLTYNTCLQAFHWHENCEICQPLNRPCRFLVDGAVIEADIGDLIFVDRKVIHRFLVEQDGTEVRVLQFPVGILLQTDPSFPRLMSHIPRTALQTCGILDLTEACFAQMEQEKAVYSGERNAFLQSLITMLYFLLARHFADSSAEDCGMAQDFYRTVSYLNDHFTEDSLTVERLAKQLYISREKLASEFLRYAGVGIKQYLHSLRINRANQLLRDGCDVTTVAMQSGFGSLRTFNSVYKKVMGMTPSEYKKNPD